MIHDLGLKKVAEVRKEVEEVTKQIGFNGTYRELVQFITSQPGQVFESEEDVLSNFSSHLTALESSHILY